MHRISGLAWGHATVRSFRGRLAVLLTIAVLWGLPSPASAEITYIYDELGRVVGVIDPAGDTVTYAYDAVGNLLSIARRPSSQVSIIEFTPNSGPVGTPVTIFGTGFSPTPSQNTVTFNGVTAIVTAASATQLATTVPAGATTGTIRVTAPGGSATSSSPFTVTTGGPPTITGFTPAVGDPGAALTITGTNFETTPSSNSVRVNLTRAVVSSATATTLGSTIPGATGSGRITLGTPAGTATSSGDLFIPLPGFTAAAVEVTGRVAIGENRTVTLSAGKIALLVFDGTVGQRVSVASIGSGAGDGILSTPSASTLGTWYFGNKLLDPRTLPVTGTYTVLLRNTTVPVTVTVYAVPPDVAGSITPGGPPVTVTTTTPGQNARLTFAGTAGQKVSLMLSNRTIPTYLVSILKPDGTTLASTASSSSSPTYIDTQTLPVAGTYTILIDPLDVSTGSMTLTLHDIVDVTGSITINGPAVPVTISVPGQKARLTFEGTAGQPLSLVVSNAGGREITFRILNPDGTVQETQLIRGWNNITLPLTPLANSGTHTLEIDYSGSATGSVTVALTSP